VRVPDSAQGADLPPHRVVPGGVLEEFEGAFFALETIENTEDPRETALPENLADLEATIDDIAYFVDACVRLP
jgi:hypothetical protein